jgi:hypothetical protein
MWERAYRGGGSWKNIGRKEMHPDELTHIKAKDARSQLPSSLAETPSLRLTYVCLRFRGSAKMSRCLSATTGNSPRLGHRRSYRSQARQLPDRLVVCSIGDGAVIE